MCPSCWRCGAASIVHELHSTLTAECIYQWEVWSQRQTFQMGKTFCFSMMMNFWGKRSSFWSFMSAFCLPGRKAAQIRFVHMFTICCCRAVKVPMAGCGAELGHMAPLQAWTVWSDHMTQLCEQGVSPALRSFFSFCVRDDGKKMLHHLTGVCPTEINIPSFVHWLFLFQRAFVPFPGS